MKIKEYQNLLSAQLSKAVNVPAATVLGIALGEDRYLVHMNEVSEVVQAQKITPVSLTVPWFIGMANIRGNLYGITDLGVFMGREPTAFNSRSRILLVSTNYNMNSGLLVNSMLGIRDLMDFKLLGNNDANETTDAGRCFVDKEGRQWRELILHQLIFNEKFMQIAR